MNTETEEREDCPVITSQCVHYAHQCDNNGEPIQLQGIEISNHYPITHELNFRFSNQRVESARFMLSDDPHTVVSRLRLLAQNIEESFK